LNVPEILLLERSIFKLNWSESFLFCAKTDVNEKIDDINTIRIGLRFSIISILKGMFERKRPESPKQNRRKEINY
jgi:hypothetical protein